MDFNTKEVKEGMEQIATLISELMVNNVSEKESIEIGEIEQGMRQCYKRLGDKRWHRY